MRNVPSILAAAVSVVALTTATTSRADDTTSRDGTVRSQTTTTTTPSTTTPSTTQPQSNVTVQSTPPATGTTTTTAAPYAPAPMGGDTYAESTTEYRPNRPLLSTGAGLFVISYGASVVTAAVSPLDADKKLFIPLVGPWIDLDQRPGGGNNEDLNKAMIITSGIVQGAGVLLALSSLVIPETRSTTARTETAKVEKKPEVHVLPVSFGAGAGVGAVGIF